MLFFVNSLLLTEESWFSKKKKTVSNSTPCKDKRFLGKSECVVLYVVLFYVPHSVVCDCDMNLTHVNFIFLNKCMLSNCIFGLVQSGANSYLLLKVGSSVNINYYWAVDIHEAYTSFLL